MFYAMNNQVLGAAAVAVVVVLAGGLYLNFSETSQQSPGPDEPTQVVAAAPDWPGATIKTYIVKRTLENRYDNIQVEMVTMGAPEIFKSFDEVDIFIEAWFPRNRTSSIENKGEYANLGPNYRDAVIAYAVPEHTSEELGITAISDLEGNAGEFDQDGDGQGEITLISSGSTMCENAKSDVENIEAMQNYEVVCKSTSGMTAALADGAANETHVLVGSWKPLWVHGKYDTLHLKDDTGESQMTSNNHIDTVVSNSFKEKVGEHPYNFVDQMDFEGEVSRMMYWVEDGDTHKQAAFRWVEDNQDTIDSWFGAGPAEHSWCKHQGNGDMEECPDNIYEQWANGEIALE